MNEPHTSGRRPSPALLIAIVAVILSLAGTAYAGVELGRSSVGTFQLKNGSVTTAKLRDDAVTAAKAAGCPSNTVAIGPGCVEAGLRPAAGYSAAVSTCASVGGRLPLVAELDGILALGKPLGDPELVADQVVPAAAGKTSWWSTRTGGRRLKSRSTPLAASAASSRPSERVCLSTSRYSPRRGDYERFTPGHGEDVYLDS